MAIMVAGGLTFAIPGMEPAHAQVSSNPNLRVSAEGLAGGEIAATNIVEVIIDDPRIGEIGDAPPRASVDGNDLDMYQSNSGAWYGYFADNDIISSGLPGADGCTADAICTALVSATALVTNAPGEATGANAASGEVTVHLFDLSEDFTVEYNTSGTNQVVSLVYDDPDSSVSLDRTDYPRNTGVAITIDDMALNVDPTGEDVWFFVTGEDPRFRTVANIESRSTAETNLANAIEDAETKRQNALDNVKLPGDAEMTAKTERDRIIRIAQAALTDPLKSDAELLRAHQILGNSSVTITYDAADQEALDMANADAGYALGDTAFDRTLDYDYNGPDVDDADVNTLLANIGSAQYDYELVAGSPVRTIVNEADPPITLTLAALPGSAQTGYEAIVGPLNDDGTRTTEIDGGSADTNYTDEVAAARDTYSNAADTALTEGGLSGFESFSIDTNTGRGDSLLECASITTDCVITDDNIWLKFTEDGSNSSEFINYDDGVPNLKTIADAQRGLTFSVGYDNTETSGIAYSTTDIVIDAGAEWNSGQVIDITLTDSDANTNSQDADDLEVSNPDHIIPTITIGEPLTLTNGIDATLSGAVTGNPSDVADGEVSQRQQITSDGTNTAGQTLTIAITHDADTDADDTTHVVNYDLSAFEEVATLAFGGDRNADFTGTFVVTAENPIPTSFVLTITAENTIPRASAIAIDIFTFGLNDNNAVYRLELAEASNNSSDFTGTLEYIGLNQVNILEESTYGGISPLGDAIILISDDDSISVDYLDLDSTGGQTLFTAAADTPTHSGSVSLDSDGYKVADTVTVTVEDADLNTDSEKADTYTTVPNYVGTDATTSADVLIGTVLTVEFDGQNWDAGCNLSNDANGLHDSEFTLQETGPATGVFTGTFAIPAQYCAAGTPTSVTGADVSVEYVDFRDDSGSLITVSASAGIRSTTGSVSLDRTVYPVPFGVDDVTDDDDDAFFGTFGDALPQGDLTVYVSINDADFDTSSNGVDSIPATAKSPLEISIIRGSGEHPIDVTDSAISETAADSGIFEYELTLSYDDGPESNKCPVGMDGCILQGDILHVQYSDPSDASGSDNTVTDSATFDLRNGVLQSDQTAYIIGSDMIVTLIEPDLNLDSDGTETYSLDLIEWDSDAGTANLSDDVTFGAVPSNLLETGPDTGIFQVVVGIPQALGPADNEDKLERGEEITLTYVDYGPSGSNYVGDKDEEITTTVYTSNFGATIELDQRVYTWTDKVYITVVAPDHNIDSDQVDEIGNDDDYPIRISTRGYELEEYKLVETGADTGIFTGEVILTGFAHDANDDKPGVRSGTGPTDGQIPTESESGISVSFKYSDGETVSSSALIRWNVGEVQWLEASYPASGSGIVRVIDPDLNLNPEAVDNFDITVWSDSDGGGIDLTVTETNAATGIFEGTVFFGVGVDTSGHRLRVVEGDTVTAQYYDNTLPAPFKETERVRVGATTLIGTIVPPLERVPISDLRAVDSFGSTLDAISVDSQIQLEADLTNNQDRAQEFAYLVQIQNEGGVTVSLNWITGSLTAGQSLSPASSWTPTEAGTYEVTAFVWESIENPTALSPTATIAITVN